MSRAYCYQCHRAKVACLCGSIDRQVNKVKLIVLQHPDETHHAKGSAIIAKLGLANYQCWVGEDFSQLEALADIIKQHKKHIALLFPGEQAEDLDVEANPSLGKLEYLIVIDATWRKAKKIVQLNPCLHELPMLKFSPHFALAESAYRIRKAPQPGYLSTVESIVSALRLLEQQPDAYQPLLDLFAKMVNFQIDSMGEEVYKRHHSE